MKRFIGLFLMMVLLVFSFSAFADEWAVDYFVDDFGDKTDYWYIRTSTVGTYNYNNSSSGIKVSIVFSDLTTHFTVYDVVDLQYLGEKLVNNSSATKEYDIMIKTATGETSSFTGHLAAQSDKIEISNIDEAIRLAKAISQNKETRIVIKPKGSNIEKYAFTIECNNFLEAIPEGSFLKNEVDDRQYAFIDTTGNIISVCGKWDSIYQHTEGLSRVKKGEKWGFINTAGKLFIPCEWDDAASFNEGLARVKQGDKYGYIDIMGTLVIPCIWEEADSHFSDGFASVLQGNQYGYIDTTGEVVIPCKWDEAFSFSEGLAAVKQGDKYGYIDTTGKLVIPCKWDLAFAFNEGLAPVESGGKYGVINTKGKIVIPCEFGFVDGFSDGMAQVSTSDHKKGYINSSGKLLMPRDEYEFWGGCEFSNGLVEVRYRDRENDCIKAGFVDKTGNLVIPCVWDSARLFSADGLAPVEQDNKFGYINSNGDLIIPCKWDKATLFVDGIALVYGSIE